MDTALSPEQRADRLLANLTFDEEIVMVHGSPGNYVGNTTNIARLGIPALRLQDGPAGIADGAQQVTPLPAPILLAASWDTALAREYGDVLGAEARAKGVHVLLAPMINLIRVPQDGRAFEMLGEDPLLTASIASAEIHGIQGHRVIACAKHFVGNEQETNRGNENSVVDERTLHEIYAKPFLDLIRAGVDSVCTAYNRINGDWSSDTPLLLDLKHRSGFEGFALSDWGANFDLEPATTNGLDLEMPAAIHFGDSLKTAIQSGTVPAGALDDKVRRILATLFRSGILDDPPSGDLSSPAFTLDHAQFARDAAAGGMVLLTNRAGLLPLDSASLHSIAVSGSVADQNPIWTGRGSAQVFYFPYYITPLNSISNRAGSGVTVTYIAGDPTNITAAVQQAQRSDVAVVCVGEQTGEGTDRSSLSLPQGQDDLVSAVAAVNTNTIVVLYAGAATLMPWADSVAAIVVAWYPGLEGSTALSSILFGDVNPSGKLPVTFPVLSNQVPANLPQQYPGANLQVLYSEGLRMGYRWYDASNVTPLYPFGHGLSYTTFTYSNLTVGAVSPSGQVTIGFDLHNTGSRQGAEVAQLYLGFPPFNGEPPKLLRGFQKIALSPGQSTHVTLALDWEDLACWDTNAHDWSVPLGTFQVMIGSSSRDIRLMGSFNVSSSIPASETANLALYQPANASGSARYVQLNVTASGTGSGFVLGEIELYSPASAQP